ncbi:MAG: DNA-directed RNA polymerase subunit F [Candidatus Micrarchaeota archaeon]|nr:DNA-directed RNA polymerase subunit F [Candidatus Micrarchaeota archaeon]
MIGKKQTASKMVSIADVLDILEDRQKDGELGYEQQIELEHAKKFSKLGKKEAEKMKEELMENGMGEKTATKTVEIMPIDITQLKLILVMDRLTLDDEACKKLMGIVESHRGKQ